MYSFHHNNWLFGLHKVTNFYAQKNHLFRNFERGGLKNFNKTIINYCFTYALPSLITARDETPFAPL